MVFFFLLCLLVFPSPVMGDLTEFWPHLEALKYSPTLSVVSAGNTLSVHTCITTCDAYLIFFNSSLQLWTPKISQHIQLKKSNSTLKWVKDASLLCRNLILHPRLKVTEACCMLLRPCPMLQINALWDDKGWLSDGEQAASSCHGQPPPHWYWSSLAPLSSLPLCS